MLTDDYRRLDIITGNVLDVPRTAWDRWHGFVSVARAVAALAAVVVAIDELLNRLDDRGWFGPEDDPVEE